MAKLRVDKIAAPIVKDEFTGSVHFDGTTQNRITIPSTTDFAPGTGDFTIEMWVYHTDLTGQQTYFGDTYGNTSGIYTYKTSNNEISLYDSAQRSLSAQNVIKLNTWHHIAWTRENGVLRAFLDGVIVDEDTYTGSFTDTDYFIGDTAGTSSGEMIGYISNLRYCKNHAVYTSNFTVPTRELVPHKAPPKGVVFPAADNITTLLACQSSTDATLDATGRHTLSASDGVTAADANPGLFRRTNISSTTSENTGSVYFDGTDDSLNIAANADFAYGTGDFTWEFWFKTDAGFVGGDGGYLIDHAPADSNGNDGSVWVGSNTLYYHSAGVGGVSNLSFGGVSNETWYHVAVARESGTTRLFLNGALVNSASDAANFTTNNTRFRIGDYIGSGYAFKGYISNLRICKGHAVYKSQFIPPTRELEVHQGPDDDRTVLLACYDGENIFAEKTGRHIIAAYGDRTSSPTPTATDSPIGITTVTPGLTRNVDPTAGPIFQGGAGYASQNWLTLPKGTTAERMPNFATNAVTSGGTRAVYHSFETPTTSTYDTLEYLNIATLGSVNDFGNLTNQKFNQVACSSNTRGLFASGYTESPASGNNFIDYVTIMSTGNAKDFGDLSFVTYVPDACSNQIRGIYAGGAAAPNYSGQTSIDYVTISTLGNGKDFGDLTRARHSLSGVSSPTRGVFAAGNASPVANLNNIDYVTIASTGNAQDFGDIGTGRAGSAGASSSIRGLFAGGYNPSVLNSIDFITIATTGNTQDFGDLTAVRRFAGGTSSTTRGVFIAGYSPSATNTIDYVNIQTTGNAVDFGETINKTQANACSNGHGGLG